MDPSVRIFPVRAYQMTNHTWFSLLLVFCLGVSGVSQAAQEMPCVPDGECSDPCIYFSDKVVLIDTNDGAKIKYQGEVRNLDFVSSKDIRKRYPLFEIPGDIQVRSFSAGKLKVTARYKVEDTSCAEKTAKGKWVQRETCCWTEQSVELTIHGPRGKEEFSTNWRSGC